MPLCTFHSLLHQKFRACKAACLKSDLRCSLDHVSRQMKSQQIRAVCSVTLVCAGLGEDHTLPNPVCTRARLL